MYLFLSWHGVIYVFKYREERLLLLRLGMVCVFGGGVDIE